MARKEFSDRQKAEIFVLDRATCAYSGCNLWLLDRGADSRYVSDWADHLDPASKGGDACLENGVCASWVFNFAKLDSRIHPPMLFYRGLPTPNFFHIYNLIPDEIAINLTRFTMLHYSDWYLNRAIWRACLGVCWLHESSNRAGETRSRDAHYYARAALKFLAIWRKIVSNEGVPTLEQRGLNPAIPGADQLLMLAIRNSTSEESLVNLMRELLPFHSANFAALSAQNKVTAYECVSVGEANEMLAAIREDKRVSPAVLATVEKNFSLMKEVVWGNIPRFVLTPE